MTCFLIDRMYDFAKYYSRHKVIFDGDDYSEQTPKTPDKTTPESATTTEQPISTPASPSTTEKVTTTPPPTTTASQPPPLPPQHNLQCAQCLRDNHSKLESWDLVTTSTVMWCMPSPKELCSTS
ncbi:hypothetical protein OS493_016245 [Desmophyllum pertusum]|uniref:Uncharacterized protein n=1 Tax=Desmophyllum pertusum TaxID=174260 RepID=A0A9X0A339_9CNID|nr:hypothetical protein OS493_016245 [Desmophyllum pertusum]